MSNSFNSRSRRKKRKKYVKNKKNEILKLKNDSVCSANELALKTQKQNVVTEIESTEKKHKIFEKAFNRLLFG